MEGFNEQVVKRKNKTKQLVIKILAVFLLIAIPGICFVIGLTVTPYMMMVGLFIFLGGIYGVWYTFTSLNVEYEYSVVSDTLYVSKIISLRKRKKMCNVPIKDIDMLEIGDEKIRNMSFVKTYMAVADIDKTDEAYFAVFNDPARGKSLLAFNPNEQILQGLKPYLKKELVLKHFYNRSV
ncbi:MAG TPA: hypothetical protein DEO32_04795 [Ruminococcaceae bacterium]|nr:hypothetical protein [Oscillospiraceae bacterium]